MCRVLRTPYRGSPDRPRCPVVSCWTRWRQWSRASPASWTTRTGIHDLHRVGEFFLRCGLEPGEAVHGDHLNPVAPRRVLLAEPLLEGLLGAALHHVQQPGRTPSLAQRGEVDDHGDELVAPARVPPHVLVHPDRGHTLEAMLIVYEDPASLFQDGGVGAVPGHAQTLSDPGDGEVLDDDALQGPTQSAPGQFRARLGRPSGVLPPHTPTPRTAVATHSHHQCHRSPARGLVGEATDHGVAGDPFAPTLATPPVIVHHPAGHLAAIREDSLANHHEAEVIQAGERGQIGGSKGSVGHVGVFQMGSVGTPIIGRPRPSHPPRHASQTQPPATPRIAKSLRTDPPRVRNIHHRKHIPLQTVRTRSVHAIAGPADRRGCVPGAGAGCRDRRW